jgi:thiol-disulfide isomerase/thioredoxin
MLRSHDEYAKYAKDSAGRFKDILNKPAADWAATDIDGKPVKLSDFRGKVVVMDFWYRGCGWCMYAMPQVIKLSDDYKEKGLVVLGMNTDSDEKDARFVIDAMGMKYATIKATGIPEKFGVQGFPTLIIIDQQGIVRDVHVGYSPKLREEVGKKIEELLAAK